VRKLPSLTAIRAFEAAARHQSFRAAGQELHVTHSAISHQIADLERDLKIELFIRHGRSVRLSRAGETYFAHLRESLDQIAQSTELIRRTGEARDLTVQAYVTFSMMWLIPRLPEFEARHPAVRLRLSTSDFTWNFDLGNVDVGIIYSRATAQPNLLMEPLFDVTLFPVCSPAYLKRTPVIKKPADLARHRLLRVYTTTDDWQPWLKAVGLPQDIIRKAQEFDSYLTVLQAARHGLGIAMANSHYVVNALRKGELVQATEPKVPQPGRWYLICEQRRANDPHILAFRNWVKETLRAEHDTWPER
jgi:LysR family glycine cleavage system transcriptional activator